MTELILNQVTGSGVRDDIMPGVDLDSLEQVKSQALRLLADCYLDPGPNLKQTISGLSQLVSRFAPEFLAQLEKMTAYLQGRGIDRELALDHARLFVGPFSLLAPPYGSVYLEEDGRVMGDSTATARDYYLAEGLDLTQDFNQPADHISVELEFIHFLSARRIEAQSTGDRDETERLLRLENEFDERQLKPWLPKFTGRIQEEAETVFYKALAQLTLGLINQRNSDMNIPLAT